MTTPSGSGLMRSLLASAHKRSATTGGAETQGLQRVANAGRRARTLLSRGVLGHTRWQPGRLMRCGLLGGRERYPGRNVRGGSASLRTR